MLIFTRVFYPGKKHLPGCTAADNSIQQPISFTQMLIYVSKLLCAPYCVTVCCANEGQLSAMRMCERLLMLAECNALIISIFPIVFVCQSVAADM